MTTTSVRWWRFGAATRPPVGRWTSTARNIWAACRTSPPPRAEAAELQTQDQLAQAQGQLFADLVDLYRSLGGGWSFAGSEPGRAADGGIAASADQTANLYPGRPTS